MRAAVFTVRPALPVRAGQARSHPGSRRADPAGRRLRNLRFRPAHGAGAQGSARHGVRPRVLRDGRCDRRRGSAATARAIGSSDSRCSGADTARRVFPVRSRSARRPNSRGAQRPGAYAEYRSGRARRQSFRLPDGLTADAARSSSRSPWPTTPWSARPRGAGRTGSRPRGRVRSGSRSRCGRERSAPARSWSATPSRIGALWRERIGATADRSGRARTSRPGLRRQWPAARPAWCGVRRAGPGLSSRRWRSRPRTGT